MSVKTSRNTTDIRTVDLTTLLSDTSVQELLDIVSEHPEWSIQRMVANHPKNAKGKELLTYQDAREILQRLHLSTATQRKIRQIKTAEWEQAQKQYKKKRIARNIPDFLSYIAHRKQFHQQQRIEHVLHKEPRSNT